MSRDATARVAVELVAGRARITRLSTGEHLGPRVLGLRGTSARIALIGVSATLLAGDDLRIDVEAGPGVRIELIEPSGTVAYNARGRRADWTAGVRVGRAAQVVWAGAPFVTAHGANVRRHTEIDLDEGASMLLREMLVLGRSGEEGGRLSAATRAMYAGRPLLVEELDLRDPGSRSAPGMLGGNRVLATAALLGIRPEHTTGRYETPLAGPGALARSIAGDAHVATERLADTWAAWRKFADAHLVAGSGNEP